MFDFNKVSEQKLFSDGNNDGQNYTFNIDTEEEISSNYDLQSDFEKVVKDNQTLTESIASYKIDLQTTQKLLQIEKKKTSELEEELRREKNTKDASMLRSMSATQNNDEQRKQIENLKLQISKLTNDISQKDNNINTLENSINAFIKNWNTIFTENFTNIQEIEREIPELSRNISSYKHATQDKDELLEKITKDNVNFQSQVEHLKKQLNTSNTQLSDAKKDFAAKLNKIAEENCNKMSDLQDKYGKTLAENRDLKSTNEELHNRIESLQLLLDDKTEVDDLNGIIDNLKAENVELKKTLKVSLSKNDQLISKLQDFEDYHNETANESSGIKKALLQSQKDLKAANDQIERMKFDFDEINRSIETEKKQSAMKDESIKELTQKTLQDADEIDSLQKNIKTLNLKIQDLSANTDTIAHRVDILEEENNKLNDQLKKEKENNSKLTSQLNESESHNSTLKEDNAKLTEELNKQRPEIVPICAWTTFGPHPELKNVIQQIVTSKEKNISQKICEVLVSVGKFYETELSSANSALNIEIIKSDILCKLMTEVSSLLKIPLKTPNEIINYKDQYLANVKQEFSNLKKKMIEMEMHSADLNKYKDYDAIKKEKENLEVKMLEKDKDLYVKTKELSKLNDQIRSLSAENTKLKDENDELANQNQTNESFMQKINELTKTVYEQKLLLQAASQKIAVQSNSKGESEKKNKNEADFLNNLAKKKFEKEKRVLENRIKELEEANIEYQEAIEEIGRNLQAKKEAYRRLKQEIKNMNKNQEIVDVPETNEVDTNNDLADEYKKKLETSSKKNDELQLEITALNMKLNKAQTTVKRLQKQVKQTEEDKETINEMYNDARQRLTTEVKHIQTKLENEKSNLSEKFAQEIDQIKIQNEGVLREIFGIIGSGFKQFYDARTKLDMDKVKEIVNSASSQLNKLRDEDKKLRSLLGLEEKDNIEDVITSILFNQ